MSTDGWEMIVRVKLPHCMEHSEGEAALREVIKDEGGPMQVIVGWCDPEDIEIVSLVPVTNHV